MKVRVKIKEYKDTQMGIEEASSWNIGTVVGESDAMRSKANPTFNDTILGAASYLDKRFLVKLEDGKVIEVWDDETYELLPEDMNKKGSK